MKKYILLISLILLVITAFADDFYRFIKAVENGRVDKVKHYISKNVDINKKSILDETALMIATQHNQIEIVKLLIEEKADLNAVDSHGVSALIMAVIYQKKDIAKLLIQAEADVNYEDQGPLHWAVCFGEQTEIIKILLDKGINLKERNGSLIIAASNGYIATVKLLLEAGAEINAQNRIGKTALMEAASAGNLETVKMLLQAEADISLVDENKKTALFYAKDEGHIDVVDFLIRAGADDAEDQKYELIKAIKQEDTAKVKQLIDKGTSVNDVYGEQKRTALMIAADTGNREIVKLLIDAGANINKPDNNKKTPLVYAVSKGYIELVKLFLKLLNKQNTDYDFVPCCHQALVEAADKGNIEIVKLLLQTISEIQDPNYNSIKVHGVLDKAIENGHLKTVKLLLEKGVLAPRMYFNYPADLIRGAVENGHVDVLEYLFKKIMTEKALQKSGALLLYWAA
jgi:ankyrin repeat protein